MAVLQISKIQVRRGQKNSASGVPQLSSAEFAWAVDTQELFIGNGSVAEGAPYVGNTKVLTEHDNILELANSYQFGSLSPLITQSVPRSLQEKLDEIEVSVTDFGALGDGIADNADFFERAADQLFNSGSAVLKKVLVVPNGNYLFSRDVVLPSGTILRGETINGSILNINTHSISFDTESPSEVLFENLTVSRTTGQLVITKLTNSIFSKVKFVGNYTLSNSILDATTSSACVYWENESFGTRVTDVTFDNCIFESSIVAIRMDQTSQFDTEIIIQDSLFTNCYSGIVINGVSSQGNNWSVYDCRFIEIAAQAILANFGTGMMIKRSIFKKCGNGINTPADAVTPIVEFGQYQGNEILDSTCDRLLEGELVVDETTVAVPSVLNVNKTEFTNLAYIGIDLTDNFKKLAVFSSALRCFKIDYILRLGVGLRKGTLMIGTDNDFENVSISDNFTYSSESSTSDGGIRMTEFIFDAVLRDNNADDLNETLVLSYRNPTAHPIDDSTSISGVPGDISFSVCYGV